MFYLLRYYYVRPRLRLKGYIVRVAIFMRNQRGVLFLSLIRISTRSVNRRKDSRYKMCIRDSVRSTYTIKPASVQNSYHLIRTPGTLLLWASKTSASDTCLLYTSQVAIGNIPYGWRQVAHLPVACPDGWQNRTRTHRCLLYTSRCV